MIAFLTGVSNGFDAELVKVLAANGFEVYVGYADEGFNLSGFAQCVAMNPDDTDSIAQACQTLSQAPGHIDLYIETSNYQSKADCFTVSDEIDYEVVKEVYTTNVLRPIHLCESLYPLMEKGELKRYGFITSAKASINLCDSVTGYGYNMSKAGLHNFMQMFKLKLMPKGFTFRAFDPSTGELSDEAAAQSAFYYFTRRRAIENRDDESNLIIRNAFGRQASW